MRLLLIALLAPCLVSKSIPAPDMPQEIFADSMEPREKVPGDSPAFYSRVKAMDQLLDIAEVTASPNPPVAGKRFFYYLRGELHDEYLGLNETTLAVYLRYTDYSFDYKGKLGSDDYSSLIVRDDSGRIGPLVRGVNEIMGTMRLYGIEPPDQTWEYFVELVAKLPDESILFSFEVNATLSN